MGSGTSRKIMGLMACAGLATVCVGISGVGRGASGSGVQPVPTIDPETLTGNPVYVCFHPTVNPPTAEQLAAVEAIVGQHLLDLRYNEVASWTSQGVGTVLSWSLVPDGLSISSGIGEGVQNSTLFATMDAKFGAGNRAFWIDLIRQSFDRWSQLSGNTYVYVTNGTNDWDDGSSWGTAGNDATRGDIRIAMKFLGGSGGVLAYNSFPTNGDMVLDSSETWQSSSNSYRFMRNIVMHEHGHGLGFAHLCPVAGQTLMEPFLNTSFDGPQHDDIRAVHRGYGDPYELNETTGSAFEVGTLLAGTTNLSSIPSPSVGFGTNTSLDDNSDRDYYRINIATASLLSATLTPIGRTYDDSEQFSGGACDSGNIINSAQIHDLRLRLLDASGATILDLDANGLGGNESFTDQALPAGDCFLYVFTSSTTNESQLYTLSVNLAPAPECTTDPQCDDGDPSNGVEVCVAGECVTLPFPDCNANGLDDNWEIANGFADDCNENGIPDACDLASVQYAGSSPELTPFGSGAPQQHTFEGTPFATTDVTLDLTAQSGDFNSANEFADVFVGGVSVGSVFISGADCNPSNDSLVVPAATWNAARDASGNVLVQLNASPTVNPNLCNPQVSSVSVSASYSADAISVDENTNGIPDECEVSSGCGPADTTTTGTSNGVPDGVVDISDYSFYLTLWGAGNLAADVTTTGTSNGVPDGVVDISDFSYYLTLWGAGCP